MLAYQQYLEARQYAPKSIEYRIAALEHFTTWCEARGLLRIEQITRPVLLRYQRHLAQAVTKKGGKPLSVATQRNRLTAVKVWFRFLMRENLILTNPASELELPKPAKRLPKHTLTAEDAEKILNLPDTETVAGLRDRGMLEVFYSTGIRRQELINLQIDDINASAGVLAIRQGKGNKDRFVPIGERALAAVQHYLEDGRPLLGPRHGESRVFLDDAGQAWEPNRLSRLIKKYIDKARVGKSGSCHLFRHSVATLMLENGADIRFIQQLLGHALDQHHGDLHARGNPPAERRAPADPSGESA